ncbi:phytanoyl-CoA dioxygenase family protein [Flindersiella endophytica]
MLTTEQHEEFERCGLLRLPGAIRTADTALMCDRIWEHAAEAHGMKPADPDTWLVEQRLSGLQKLARRHEFARIGSLTVRSALNDLLGEWEEPRRWAGLLVTFPRRDGEPWDVPTTAWHNDFTWFDGASGVRAVQYFALLNDIEPSGGATLVLTGSHRLLRDYADAGDDGPHPKRLRQKLGAEHPWLRALWERDAAPGVDRVRRYLDEGGEADGVPLRVVELCGQAGDVFMMHCDTFHCAAPNCGDQPRMMATGMIRRAEPPAGRPSS